MQGAQDVAGTEEQVFVERGQLGSDYDCEIWDMASCSSQSLLFEWTEVFFQLDCGEECHLVHVLLSIFRLEDLGFIVLKRC